ncbi:hypothetical protein WS67_22245 [Burkholderia singularis]|uniref:Uncharacterized protein n=1 Tax=Burkholderia singularis TaxID=1503053 RepID=A0A103DWC3_9BURK|nr:hypothetical protein WS67_22245 [Burkholderia singularis]
MPGRAARAWALFGCFSRIQLAFLLEKRSREGGASFERDWEQYADLMRDEGAPLSVRVAAAQPLCELVEAMNCCDASHIFRRCSEAPCGAWGAINALHGRFGLAWTMTQGSKWPGAPVLIRPSIG